MNNNTLDREETLDDEEDGTADGATPRAVAVAPLGELGEDEPSVMRLFARLTGPVELIRDGDRATLRDHLVLVHTGLVDHCARGFAGSGEPIEDLIQEGYVGLIKAVDRYDVSKGVRFSTYACHLINGEIRHYLRDLGKMIHEPGWHSELRQRIARGNDSLTQKLGRPATAEEIATELDIDAETVREVQRKQQTLTVDSLDETERNSGEEGRGVWHEELAMATAPDEARVDDKLVLRAAMPQLRDLEKQALTLFFFQEQSKTEIARQLDISVNYVAYLVKKGIEHLRQIIDAGEPTPERSWSQQEARAAYLLAHARDAILPAMLASAAPGGAEPERAAEKPPRDRRRALPAGAVPRVARTGVSSFTHFAGWLDEEVQRANRYNQEFSVLWLHIANWDAIIRPLNATQAGRILAKARTVTRRCCRSSDRVALMPSESMPGLHFVVLMPHTGLTGKRVAERWLKQCQASTLSPAEPSMIEEPHKTYAFALFPEHGKTVENLLSSLGEQITKQAP